MATIAVDMDEDSLLESDKEILSYLKEEGRAPPAMIEKNTNFSQATIQNRLNVLMEGSHVKKVAHGLYELENDPRDDP